MGLGIPVAEFDQIPAEILVEQEIAGQADATFAHFQAAPHYAAHHQRQAVDVFDRNVIDGVAGRNLEQAHGAQVQAGSFELFGRDKFQQLIDLLQALDVVFYGVEKTAVDDLHHHRVHGSTIELSP